MSLETVIDQLQANARTLYRKAIDADNRLDKLQADGLGKHQAVFGPDQGFTSDSPRFMPYVEELGKQVVALQSMSPQDPAFEPGLKQTVKQMELLFATLAQFKSSLDQRQEKR